MEARIVKQIDTEMDMEALGEMIAPLLKPGDLVYLAGELGAGKTTLARGIVRGLGYQGRVNSPTFTLMNVYQAGCTVYHFDFYRLDEAGLLDLGLEDYLGREGICIVEWPQVGKNLLPDDALWIDIILEDDDYEGPRQAIVRGTGGGAQLIIERLKTLVNSSC
ncbi:MAG: tRNA (adenosine(37)-N6)-threonylcarbamoyltransferase complex ATPase subunit type 1 TsaE [Syntrophomonadaceae bacterium]